MYKNLEDEKKVVVTAVEKPEGTCECSCGLAPEENFDASSEPPSPEVNTTAVLNSVYWVFNG